MELNLDHLVAAMTNNAVIWEGDWNPPLAVSLAGFSRAAPASILSALIASRCRCRQPPSRVGVSRSAASTTSQSRRLRLRAAGHVAVGRSLSDHDAYWVDAQP